MARHGNHGIDALRVALVVAQGQRRQELRRIIDEGASIRYAFTAAGIAELRGLRPPADAYLVDGGLLSRGAELASLTERIPGDAALVIRDAGNSGALAAALSPALFGVGFISSDSSGVDAEAALHAAFHGLFVWDPRLGPLPSAGPVDDGDATSPAVPEPPAADALTRREADVLEYLARGAGNQEIAGALNVSVNTVKFHLSSLYAKLEVSNRTQALREAARRGYLML